MRTCIICRKSLDESLFNDEHVIPDALGGYYHINNICIECNSEIGYAIDSKLTNHFFSNFERYGQKLKGKKGDVPNPFAGTHVLSENPNQKVRFDLIDGEFSPYLIPQTEIIDNQMRITVDAKDANELPKIIEKKRKKLAKEGKKVTSQSEYIEKETVPHPGISIKSMVDINDFKLALLKIAYEFTIDILPDYLNDPQAIVISSVIKNNDFKYNGITFIGDGFTQEIFRPFSHLFEFENKTKHYLFLHDFPGVGLICGVNIFNVFNIYIVMSKSNYMAEEQFIVGVNNIPEKSFCMYSTKEVVNLIFDKKQIQFQYYFDTQEDLDTFQKEQSDSDFSFFEVDGNVPLFDNNGVILYNDISDKIRSGNLFQIPYGDCINEVGDRYVFNEKLYVKIMPSNRLIQIVSAIEYWEKGNRL